MTFDEWFDSQYPKNGEGAREKYRDSSVMVLMRAAFSAGEEAEREVCAKRARAAIDPELETADGESLQQHVEDAIMARSNACSAAETPHNTISDQLEL